MRTCPASGTASTRSGSCSSRACNPRAVCPAAGAVPDVPPPGTAGITTNTIGTFWQIFENAEYGFGRFEVAGAAVLTGPSTLPSLVPAFAVEPGAMLRHASQKPSEL